MGIGLYTKDLADNLTQEGHSVSVLTMVPYYPWWETPRNLESYLSRFSVEDGIEITRVQVKIPNQPGTVKRLIFEFRMWMAMSQASHFSDKSSFDSIISTIPSLGAGLVGVKLSKRHNVPHLTIVQDISSIGIRQSKMSLGSIIYPIARFIESYVLRNASKIAIVSDSMYQQIAELSEGRSLISTIHNYSIVNEGLSSQTLDEEESLGTDSDTFNVIYTGSLAQKQNLDNLLEAAKLLEANQRVKITIYGHGNSESRLIERSKNLKNLKICPAIRKEDYLMTLKSADLLLVHERASQTSMALPSKIVSYFASGTPVLAAIPTNGASFSILDQNALIVEADNPRLLSEKILFASENPQICRSYATAATDYFQANLTSAVGRGKYVKWILD
jgi:glycosyltransferase involved in cell wall biosynthesis